MRPTLNLKASLSWDLGVELLEAGAIGDTKEAGDSLRRSPLELLTLKPVPESDPGAGQTPFSKPSTGKTTRPKTILLRAANHSLRYDDAA
jgi:hypothetical protein